MAIQAISKVVLKQRQELIENRMFICSLNNGGDIIPWMCLCDASPLRHI